MEDGEGVGGTEMDHDQGLGCFYAFFFLNDIASYVIFLYLFCVSAFGSYMLLLVHIMSVVGIN